jgi:hypothetical protein
VFEVTVTSGGVDRLEGYRRMGVVEVWFWEDGALSIYHLHADGYQKIANTELLEGFPLKLFNRYITYHDQYDAVTEFLAATQPPLVKGVYAMQAPNFLKNFASGRDLRLDHLYFTTAKLHNSASCW